MYKVSTASGRHAKQWGAPKNLHEIETSAEPPERTKEWKLGLPMYAPQIICEEGTPTKIEDRTAPVNSTGLYIADFDCIPKEKGTKTAAKYILSEVLNMDSTVAAYISPMGKGVHALVAGPRAETYRDHTRIWKQIIPAYFEDLTLPDGYGLDHAGSDITRRLFISPDRMCAPNLNPTILKRPVLDEDVDYNPPTLKVLKYSVEEVKAILEAIPAEYCDNRDTWLTLLMSIKNELNGEGKAVGLAWSKTSKNYGSDTSFNKDWRSLEDNRSDGVTGATLNWYAKKYAPNIYGQWRRRCAKASSVAADDYGVKYLSEEQWQSLIEQVPDLGRLRRLAIESNVSPTGALFAMCATVPHMLGFGGWGIRVEGYFGNKPQPLSTCLTVFGTPGKGKSKVMEWVKPPHDRDDIQEYCMIQSGATSGQSFAKAFVRNMALNGKGIKKHQEYLDACKNSDGKAPKAPEYDVHTEQYITKPNLLVTFDEANIFDQAVEGTNHGKGLIGVVCGGFFGSATNISQMAATDEANRILPRNTPIQIGVWVNAQPHTAIGLMNDTTGLTERFLLIAMSPGEYYTRRDINSEEKVWSELLKDWKPPRQIKLMPAYAGASLSDVDGSILFVEIAKELKVFLDHVSSGKILDGEVGMEAECEHLDDLIGDPAWCEIEGEHSLAILVRLAACIALYVGETVVERNHLEAALIMVKYSQENKVGYNEYCKAEAARRKKGEALGDRINHKYAEDTQFLFQLNKWAMRAAKKFHVKDLGKQSAVEVSQRFSYADRKMMKKDGFEMSDILGYAVDQQWLNEIVGKDLYMKGALKP